MAKSDFKIDYMAYVASYDPIAAMELVRLNAKHMGDTKQVKKGKKGGK